ncbi:MAG: type II secretion system F family protein [Patescibacteria group bacterium]
MSLFSYEAKDLEGRALKGMIDAASHEAAVEILTDKGLTPITVEERKVNRFQFLFGNQLSRIKIKDIVVLSRQLSVMASATVPIVQALRILEKQTTNPKLKVIISEIADEVEGGAKFSSTLAKYPEVFSDFYINMVASGETSGKLDEVLNYLADEQEKNYDMISKIRGAMIYPAFILGGLLLVGAVMMIFVVPKLTSILVESGVALPLSTRILIGFSNFLRNFWWLFGMMLVGGGIGFRFGVKTPQGKHLWHLIQLKIPVVGTIYQNIYLVRFTRSMYTLIVGGVPLTRSLAIVSDVVGNAVFKDIIDQTIKEVEDGNSIATVFSQSKVIPSMVSQMMIVGEKTGRLEEVFKRLSDFYTREANNLVANLVTLLEPMVMLVMGVSVGFMVSAILLPMYRLSSGA